MSEQQDTNEAAAGQSSLTDGLGGGGTLIDARVSYVKKTIGTRFFHEPARTREKLRRLVLRRKEVSHLARLHFLGNELWLRLRLAVISRLPCKETPMRSTSLALEEFRHQFPCCQTCESPNVKLSGAAASSPRPSRTPG